MKELDVVKLIKTHEDISIGTKGTIVHKYDDENYEVEFMDANDNTIGVVTIKSKEIELFIEYKMK